MHCVIVKVAVLLVHLAVLAVAHLFVVVPARLLFG